jgi:hypothetical protein
LLFPASTAHAELPFLRVRKNGRAVLVGVVPARGASPVPRKLANLPCPEGQTVFEARVIGCQGDQIVVLVQAGEKDDSWPRSTTLWWVASRGNQLALSRSQAIPTSTNYCLDCGPFLRLGPRGALWRMQTARGEYWILKTSTQALEGKRP